jgi:hypothetical protein
MSPQIEPPNDGSVPKANKGKLTKYKWWIIGAGAALALVFVLFRNHDDQGAASQADDTAQASTPTVSAVGTSGASDPNSGASSGSGSTVTASPTLPILTNPITPTPAPKPALHYAPRPVHIPPTTGTH